MAPTTMPATAPLKVKRFQKRLRRMAGPKAAPKTPQALDTRSMMEPAFGLEAMMRARRAITRTTTRPVQSISLSVVLPLRMRGLYTSLEKAEAAESSWLSAVDMAAARIADSRMPEMIDGKSWRTMLMKTRELLAMFSS